MWELIRIDSAGNEMLILYGNKTEMLHEMKRRERKELLDRYGMLFEYVVREDIKK
jgi:hypothetical protein